MRQSENNQKASERIRQHAIIFRENRRESDRIRENTRKSEKTRDPIKYEKNTIE